MKKLFILVLPILFLLSLTSCTDTEDKLQGSWSSTKEENSAGEMIPAANRYSVEFDGNEVRHGRLVMIGSSDINWTDWYEYEISEDEIINATTGNVVYSDVIVSGPTLDTRTMPGDVRILWRKD